MEKSILVIIAVAVLLVGIFVAYTADLNTSTIYDENVGTVTTSIGMHICCIMGFVLASSVLLLSFCQATVKPQKINTWQYLCVAMHTISGLFFSVASGYHARSNHLSEYYATCRDLGWFMGDITSASWFASLPEIAEKFSSCATIWYILMFVTLCFTIVLMLRYFPKVEFE